MKLIFQIGIYSLSDCAFKKLPKESLGLWERSLEKKIEISKWEEMENFPTNRFVVLSLNVFQTNGGIYKLY